MSHQTSRYHHPKCRRRRSFANRSPLVALALGLLAIDAAAAQFIPSSRWGQASTVAGTTLLVQGGKVDPTNSYSYTAAPNTNDLFALDLSKPFRSADPPWTYLSGSQDPASSQGPAIAFHTLSAYSSKRALSFGGQGGPDMAIETNADSAWTLQFWNQSSVKWTQQAENWGDQPIRRVYHSAAVYDKAVWITGGEKADGSGLGFAETYMFEGSGSSGEFTNLQAAEAGGVLSDIVGHGSVVLPNGLLVAIGGYSPSHQSMTPMTTIYTLDTTQTNAVWGLMVAQGSQIPSPRRNFALAVLPNNTLLIHGGCDSLMQTFYSDGFALNFGTNPPTWSPLPSALSNAVGPRIDHMAVGVSNSVIFGFGRSPNGPAPAALAVYDFAAGTVGDSYQPDSSGSTDPNSNPDSNPTATNGQPTVTGTPSTRTHSASRSATVSVSVSTCVSTGTVTVTCTPTGTDAPDGAGSKNRAVIALGSVLGILGALAITLGLVWWCFRRRGSKSSPSSRRPYDRPWTGLLSGYRHRPLLGSGDTEDPVLPGAAARGKIPTVGMRYADSPRGIVGLLSAPFRRSQESSPKARRDMLEDEDDREFFTAGHGGGLSRGSTTSLARPTFKKWGSSTRHLWNEVVNASTTSFKAAFGIGETRTDGPPTPGLFISRADTPEWWEKNKDPFADDALLMANLPNSPTAMGMEMAVTQRQRGGGGGHYQSATYSSISTGPYRDPFMDSSLGEHSRESTSASLSGPYVQMARSESYQPFMMPLDDPPPRSSLTPAYGRSPSPPTVDMSSVRLLPGVITPGTIASNETLAQFGLATPSTETNTSSGDRSNPRSLLTTPPTSIIGSSPTTPMRRSDSWWARFGRASLTSLGRSASGAAGLNPIRRLSLRGQIGGGSRSPTDAYATLDFRDPNPPPRLEGIEETGQSNDPSPESTRPKEGLGDSAIPAVVRRQLKHPLRDLHSKSLSSMATADSDALEKMGGRFDVIQRGRTASSETSTPAGSINEDWEYGIAHLVPLQHASPVSSVGDRPPPPPHKSSSGTSAAMPTPPSASGSGTQETYITAKTHQTSGPVAQQDGSESFKSISPSAPRRGRRPSAGLANRVAVFENMSLSTSPPGSPLSGLSPRTTSTISPLREVDKRKSGGVRYGLTERPPLFVANPDAKREGTESTVEGELLTPPPPSASSPRPLL